MRQVLSDCGLVPRWVALVPASESSTTRCNDLGRLALYSTVRVNSVHGCTVALTQQAAAVTCGMHGDQHFGDECGRLCGVILPSDALESPRNAQRPSGRGAFLPDALLPHEGGEESRGV